MVRQWNYHQFEDEQEEEDKVLDYRHKGKKKNIVIHFIYSLQFIRSVNSIQREEEVDTRQQITKSTHTHLFSR